MISVIIPTIRPDGAARCISALRDNSTEYEVISSIDEHRIGCPEMVKRMSAEAKYQWVMFLGDDTVPGPQIIDKAAAYIKGDWWGLIGLNDGRKDHLATHWLCHKNMLELTGGDFFSTEYEHCFCDNELMDIAIENGRYVYAADAILKHEWKTTPPSFDRDLITYLERKEERRGPQVGIGLPISDEKIHTQFFVSWSTLDKPDNTHLIFPKMGFHPADIAKVRNNICNQAIDKGCTHVLMMDTDQVYHDNDMVYRMLSHNLPVVGAKVHRRYPPFEPILNVNRDHVDDEIIERGGLVKVDATGTGCILIKTTALLSIEKPWFEFGKHEDGTSVGEDINFCYKAKKAGYEIYVDCDINIGHLAMIQVDATLYNIWKKLYKR